MSYQKSLNARARKSAVTSTPQTRVIPNRSDMVRNSAGGVVFSVGPWERLRRFLILGADGPTYYASAHRLTLGNTDSLLTALALDGIRVVHEIREISVEGRAARNDAALFALALCSAWGVAAGKGPARAGASREEVLAAGGGNVELSKFVRQAAFDALPKVARTGTHIMQFTSAMVAVRGWGQAPLRAFSAWFNGMDAERLALQAVKYRRRDEWTFRDLLRLAHPVAATGDHAILFDWIAHRDLTDEDAQPDDAANAVAGGMLPQFGAVKRTPRKHALRAKADIIGDARSHFRLIEGFHRAQAATTSAEAAAVVRQWSLPFEAVRSEHLSDPAVWDALLVDMPMTAMVRNLGKMTSVGLLRDGSEAARFVANQLVNDEALRRARVHPIALMTALKVYASGHGIKGSLAWSPVNRISDALDKAFYKAFQNVTPSNKRCMLNIDISASMDGGNVAGSPMSPREAAAAMALITFCKEPECVAYGFTSSGGYWGGGPRGMTAIPLSEKIRVEELCRQMRAMPMGGTDASLPIQKALDEKMAVDAFIIYTDNETWQGQTHVTQLLNRYRERSGIAAKLVSVGMTATDFSVVDPLDAGQMNVVGFDTAAPAVISDFIR